MRLPEAVRFIITTRPDAAGGKILAALRRAFPALHEVQPGQLRVSPGHDDTQQGAAEPSGKDPSMPQQDAGALDGGCANGVLLATAAPADKVMLVATVCHEVLGPLCIPVPQSAATLDGLRAYYRAVWDHCFTTYTATEAEHVTHLLCTLLAAQEPLTMSMLQQMGLSGAVPLLPGWGVLFFETEHHLYTLHKSLADWLISEASGRHRVDLTAGHTLIASHLARSASRIGSSSGPYVLRHLVRHLCAAPTMGDALDAVLSNFSFLEAVLQSGNGPLLLLDLLQAAALTPYATQLKQWLRATLSSLDQAPTNLAQRARAEDRLGLLAAAATQHLVDREVWDAEQDIRYAGDRAQAAVKLAMEEARRLKLEAEENAAKAIQEAAEAIHEAERRAEKKANDALAKVEETVTGAQARLAGARAAQQGRAYELDADTRQRHEWPALAAHIKVRMPTFADDMVVQWKKFIYSVMTVITWTSKPGQDEFASV